MLFEFINISVICQEMINNALCKHLNIFVITYLNNILIFFKTMKKHVNYVKIILKCLNQQNLQLKSKKYEFYQKNMNFFDFVVKHKKVNIDLFKLQTVKK